MSDLPESLALFVNKAKPHKKSIEEDGKIFWVPDYLEGKISAWSLDMYNQKYTDYVLCYAMASVISYLCAKYCQEELQSVYRTYHEEVLNIEEDERFWRFMDTTEAVYENIIRQPEVDNARRHLLFLVNDLMWIKQIRSSSIVKALMLSLLIKTNRDEAYPVLWDIRAKLNEAYLSRIDAFQDNKDDMMCTAQGAEIFNLRA